MKPIRVVLVGCCVLVAGGCGAQTSELRTAVSASGPSVPVNQPSDQFAANPMDAWLKGGQSDASRANNVERKVAACMKQAGLQWTPQIISEGEPSARGALREYRKTKGYGLNTVSNNITSANDPNLAIMKSLGEKELDHYLTVLEGPFVDGDRHGGCRGNSSASDPEMAKRSANPRAIQLWNQMQSAPEVTNGLKGWSLCMASAGFGNLAGPEDARRLASETSSAASETSIATADVRCAEANLWEPWRKYGEAAVNELGPP
jgi:hypothetical protein